MTLTLALALIATRFKPHPRASLRPTMLHLHSDAYASRAHASMACASRGAGVGVAGKRGRDEESLPVS